jgi:hypothetical protein
MSNPSRPKDPTPPADIYMTCVHCGRINELTTLRYTLLVNDRPIVAYANGTIAMRQSVEQQLMSALLGIADL